MQTPAYSATDALAQSAFAAVIGALSRPGTIHRLPQAGPLQLVETLIDRDTTVCCQVPRLADALDHAGARHVPLPQAEHVFLADAEDLPVAIPDLATGSALYPDRGATVIVPARLTGGPALRLTGPGIEDEARMTPAIPPETWALRDGRATYPQGFELLLIEGDRIMALPRSTRVEVI